MEGRLTEYRPTVPFYEWNQCPPARREAKASDSPYSDAPAASGAMDHYGLIARAEGTTA